MPEECRSGATQTSTRQTVNSHFLDKPLTSEQDLASIPTAQGGLSRIAIARLERANVPVAPVLKRAGLTQEVIADLEERLRQITLLDEAAIALQDQYLGFTLARDFDPRALGRL